MIRATTRRVPDQTARHVNEAIRRQAEGRVACAVAGGREAIDRRLAELDREWDIERTLETHAGTVILTGMLLGLAVDRRWLALPVFAGGFMLQHALQGWCPPVPLLRRLGFRTEGEIDEERYALKALRGDFADLPHGQSVGPVPVGDALAAVRR